MINSTQGFGAMQRMQGMEGFRPPRRELTGDEKTKVQDILSGYDPASITADDARAIFSAFRDAGIQPGKGMKETMEAAGFDADELRSLGMPLGHRLPSPPGMGMQAGQTGLNKSSLQTLQSILDQFDLANMTSEDEESLMGLLSNAGLVKSSGMIDLSV